MSTGHYGDHFTVYTYIELLCGIPETNIMLCVNYINKIKIINLESIDL